MDYNFKEIEARWRRQWAEKNTYKVTEDAAKPKYYVLNMFPYPSGAGLHVGHPLGYIASDIYARYKRLRGFNVLNPMGYDAYGLPAEQYAIQTGQHPAKTTEQNIARYREQLDKIGFSFDWDREVRTCDPKYYHWTQWAFRRMFLSYYCNKCQSAQPIENLVAYFQEKGTEGLDVAQTKELSFTAEEWNAMTQKEKEEVLMNYRIAYLGETMVNWCPALGTVLANDEVVDGVSVRGGHPVVQKKMKQWCLRVSAYAQRLLDGLEDIDWTDSLKETQRNWIGRSEGTEMRFRVAPLNPPIRGDSQMPLYDPYKTASPDRYGILKEFAKENRQYPTEAERALWEMLKEDNLGFSFRRQHIIGDYIVDFVCLSRKLIVEVDGAYHAELQQQQEDAGRTQSLEKMGFRVIRFTNEEVIADTKNVLEKIQSELGTSPVGGRQEGAFTIFTTRADTIFGVTFMVLAPESELVAQLTTPEQKDAVAEYIAQTKKRTERERISDRKVTGVFSGSYAINPFTEEKIPIWISDYVLAGYGTGAIMAVPAHDSRDYAFAKHFNLPIVPLIEGCDVSEESFDAKEGIVCNSPREAPFPFPHTGEYNELRSGDSQMPLYDPYKTASPDRYGILKEFAKENRQYPTEAERALWEMLKEDNLGVSFRRQHIIGDYIVDFVCLSRKLIVEVDGAYHAELQQQQEDAGRTQSLEKMGFRVIRFTNEEVIADTKNVLEKIQSELGTSPVGGRQEGALFSLNGLSVKQAIAATKKYVTEQGLGRVKVNYRLRDAIFSRQRYWGEPFPIYYKDGMPQVLPEECLPLELPEVSKFLPTETGEPPLGNAQLWAWDTESNKVVDKVLVNGETVFPLELSTMPGFAGSSAYYLRYMDPHNDEALVSREADEYWKNVDLYVGGSEHATGHLIYSRFWNKFLFDIGVSCEQEPFRKLVNQGMIQGRSNFVYRIKDTNTFVSLGLKDEYDTTPIHVDVNIVQNDVLDIEAFRNWRPEYADAEFVLEDGKYVCGWAVEKMSKSMYNVVNPDLIVEKYGADTLRIYEMFLGPINQSKPWDSNGIDGSFRFLRRFWNLFFSGEELSVTDVAPGKDNLKTLHKLIKKVTEDIEVFSYNTSVPAFMVATTELAQQKCRSREVLETALILLAPFAPHICEELWHLLGNEGTVFDAAWPQYDEQYLKEDTLTLPVSFSGKTRYTIEVAADATNEEVEKIALSHDSAPKYLEGKQIVKIIVVPKRIVNIVVK